MKKIKYNSILKTDDDTTLDSGEGQLDNGVISFVEKDVKVKLYIRNEIVKLMRISTEFEVELNFDLNKKTVGSYLVKDVNMDMQLNITTTFLDVKDGYIKIEYDLLENPGKFIYELRYEVLWWILKI